MNTRPAPLMLSTLRCAATASLIGATLPAYAADPATPVSAAGVSAMALDTVSRVQERLGGTPELSLQQADWAALFPQRQANPPAGQDWRETANATLDAAPALFDSGMSGTIRHRAGMFVSHEQGPAAFSGAPLAGSDPRNSLFVEGESLGVFWSVSDGRGWHVDAVAMGTRIDGGGRTDDGRRVDASGHALTLSVGAGVPIGLTRNWVIEPQAQLINQQYYPGTQASDSDPDTQSTWTGRVGARLSGRYDFSGVGLEPYLRTNLWHQFGTLPNGMTLEQVDKLSTTRGSSTVELGLGLVTHVSTTTSLYLSADYSSDMDDNDINGLIASIGLNMRW